MSLILDMATLPRHNHLVSSLFADIKSLFSKKLLYPLQEQCYLAYKGRKYSGEEELLDITYLRGLNDCDAVLDEYGKVQPDFLYFSSNEFIQNRSTSITAGVPNLVVEVWSNANDQKERDFKFRLYSSSDKCEHWYMTQDSNKVECYLGRKQIRSQSLSEILNTIDGIVFDLRFLALPD